MASRPTATKASRTTDKAISDIRVKMNEIGGKVDKVMSQIKAEGEKTMAAVDDLKKVVVAVAADAAALSDTVTVTMDLIKELLATHPAKDDPLVLEALASLEDTHAKFVESTKKLTDTVSEVEVSGGLVYPKV